MSKPMLIVVDDEPDMIEIVQYVAENIGFEVCTASNAREFQGIWDKTELSVIVMDIVLPDMDGHELLQWLVEQGCTVPILLMSGYDGKYLRSAESLGKIRGASVIGTLSKPFEVGDIETKLKQILGANSLWSDDMSVGVDILDADHKVLFQILHRLRWLLKTNVDPEALGRALADLRDYTDYHFKREEALMEACDYPNLLNHGKVHEGIIAKVEGFIQEASVEPSVLVANELVEYLENWLQVHIKELDKDYQDWMAGKDEIIRKTNRKFQEKYGIGKIAMSNVA